MKKKFKYKLLKRLIYYIKIEYFNYYILLKLKK